MSYQIPSSCDDLTPKIGFVRADFLCNHYLFGWHLVCNHMDAKMARGSKVMMTGAEKRQRIERMTVDGGGTGSYIRLWIRQRTRKRLLVANWRAVGVFALCCGTSTASLRRRKDLSKMWGYGESSRPWRQVGPCTTVRINCLLCLM